jgi:hypothetical protein
MAKDKDTSPKRIRGENNLDERIEQMMNAAGVAEDISQANMTTETKNKA